MRFLERARRSLLKRIRKRRRKRPHLTITVEQLEERTVLSCDGLVDAICGTKWDDLNGDGQRDPGEVGLVGVTVYVDANDNGQFDTGEPSAVTVADDPGTTTVDETGTYTLTGLSAGTHKVSEVVAAGWRQTYPALDANTLEIGSLTSTGAQGNGGNYDASISEDGRFVAFWSGSTNLVPNDTNSQWDAFVHDRQTGTTERVSKGIGGAEADGGSLIPKITPDGRYVLFQSFATNLVAGDTNGERDVFVYDRQTGTTERISQADDGTQANDGSVVGAITPDGRYVVFQSDATNLVAGDTNGQQDVFRYDRQTDTIQRVSLTSTGAESTGASYSSAISADGQIVATLSSATDLVPGDTNGLSDIFVYDLQANTVEIVSQAFDGGEALGGSSSAVALSADGRFVAFSSDATNLVPLDENDASDIFVYDRTADKMERVSVTDKGKEADDESRGPLISADGRYVAYYSDATNIVAGDTNTNRDSFVIDRQTYLVRRLSVAPDGTEPNGYALATGISPGGDHVTFYSAASNLVPGDTNGNFDSFVASTALQGTHSVTLAAGGAVADIDFGNRVMQGQIRGTKWNDLDEDGVQDGGEPGLENWTIFLDENQNGQLETGETSTLTDSSGNYSFLGLPDAPYTVAELIPPGWGQTYPADVTFEPLFQASIQDDEPDGTPDTFNSSTWLLSQTSTTENRVIQEFDLSLLAGQRLASAALDFELFVNNGAGQTSRPFSLYLYAADGSATLLDYSTPATYAGSATITTSESIKAFHVNITSALQTVLDQGATFVGLRVDPAGSNIFPTGIRDLELTAAAPVIGAAHEFFLTPGQIRDDVHFGNVDLDPYVASIARVDPSPTTAGNVGFTVTFSEVVTGVDVNDFATTAVGPTGTSVTSVSGSGTTYTVTVNTGSGDGTLRLDVTDNNTIRDVNNNPLEGPGFGGTYTNGPEYIIDRLQPTVTQIVLASSNPTNDSLVNFDVTFSEPLVSGVDTGDFATAVSGLTATSVQTVSLGPTTYRVTVNTGSGQGTLRLDVLANGTMLDTAGNPLAAAFDTGPHYDIDHVAPAVSSVVRLDPNPTAAATVRYTVTFSEAVTGVDKSDFSLDAVGPTGASVLLVTGSGDTYTVTIATGSGDGRLRLDVLDNNTINDTVGNSTATTFSGGQTYIVNRADPTVLSIVRAEPNPTSESTVDFTVTFSEPVSGLDAGDFALSVTGLTGTSVAAVAGLDQVHTVTANTGAGDGTLRLDLVDNDTIVDDAGTPLGGSGNGNGDFAGEAYSVFHTPGIYGTKWTDLDNDGVRDANEQGLAGVTIYLDTNQNGSYDSGEPTTVTAIDDAGTTDVDEAGRYAFTSLADGIYRVGEIVPTFYSQTYPPVAGGTGTLSFAGAVVDNQNGVDGLSGARSVVVSPDGKHVYAAASGDFAVTVFSRNAGTGTLSFVQTLKSANGYQLDSAYSVAITPDGNQVLVAAQSDDTLVIFDRDAVSGQLTARHTFRDGFSSVDGLNGASSVTVSPDGKHAYVTSNIDDSVALFSRNVATDDWSYVEFKRDNVGGVDGLDAASAVTVSPDGVHVYATGFNENEVSIFTRNATTGSLTYHGVVRDGTGGVDGLYRAVSVSVSPDGEHVYVAGHYDNAVAVFSRDPGTNVLTFVHFLRDNVGGVDGISRASAVTVSDDGSQVYVTGQFDNAVAVFSRDAGTGELTFVERHKHGQNGVTYMSRPWAVALSPDGFHVYVATASSNSIATFVRDGGAPARAHRVAYTAGQTVFNQDFGNYRLPLEVSGSQPVDGAILNAVPTTFLVDFNFDFDPSTLTAADLTVGGTAATGYTVVDSDTVEFDLPALGEGLHTVDMAAGSVSPLVNGPALLAFTSQFTIDLTAPTVTVDALGTTDANPPLTGTVNDATATISVTVDGNAYAATNNGNGTWTLADDAVALLPFGVYDVQATATDPAGNQGTDGTSSELEVVRTLVTVTGPASVTEGSVYVVSLAHHASLETITSWTLDWGDGTIDSLAGDPTSASHTYDDGTLGYPIRATAHGQSGATYTNAVAVSADPTFGSGGYAAAPFEANSTDSESEVVVQSDGKIVSIGEDGSNHWVVARHLANGTADATFGTAGHVVTVFAGNETSYNKPRGLAVQPDGKIVVVGNASIDHWAVVRYNTDGSLDTSFGANGITLIDRGNHSRLNAVVMDDSGRIIVAGIEWIGSGSDFVVARFNADGSLDTTFDGDGVALTNPSPTSFRGAEDVTLDRQGRILASGYYSSSYAAVVRYRTDGTLDNSFSSDGIFWQAFSGFSAHARAIAVDHLDRIVLGIDLIGSSGDDDWGLMRVTPYGTRDTSFDGDGRVYFDASGTGADDKLYDLVLQRDGRIVVAGDSFVTGNGKDLALARFELDGSLDTTFDTDGVWIAPPRPSVWEAIRAVALTANDRLAAVTGYQGDMELALFDLNAGSMAQVNNVVPTLTATGDASVDEGTPYTLNLTASDPGDDAVVFWTIDWGDGHQEFRIGSASSSTHVYPQGGSSYAITVSADDVDGTYDVSAPTVTVNQVARGEIKGVKWNDANGNQVRDAGEDGIGGITVYVDLNDNGILDAGEPSTTTLFDDAGTPQDEAGTYVIPNVIQGTHAVAEILPQGRTQTVPGLQALPLERVSLGTTGLEGTGDANAPQVSDDGRYVGFTSYAANLVPGDTNGDLDLFLYDRQLETLVRANLSETGQQASGNVWHWSLSGDGSTIAYETSQGTRRVTVRDLETGSYAFNLAGNYVWPSLSTDGQDLSYTYYAQNSVDASVKLRDLSLTQSWTAGSGNAQNSQSSISDTGLVVAFTSHATDIVTPDINARGDVLVYDRSGGTGVTTRVSNSPTGAQSDGDSYLPDVSGDGRYVTFTSDGANLVAGDTNGLTDIFVHDRNTGVTERVSVASDGLQANGRSLGSSISADGRHVMFASEASNLVPGDTNGAQDLFIHDRTTGTTERVNVAADGSEANATSSDLYWGQRAISADGRYAAFASDADNLVAGDTNGYADAFVTATTFGRRTGTNLVVVTAGQTTTDVDFASQGPVGEISGSLWSDEDGDGTKDFSEPALVGRTVYLDLDHDDRFDPGEPSDVTDSSGDYTFTNLLSGTYDVLTVPVAGSQQTFPLPVDNDSTYINFNANDHVFDVERNLLYLTGVGSVLRYDLQSQAFLTPFTIGTTAVRGADITADGKYLYVAGGGTSATAFHKIDLDSGAITAIPYTPAATTSSPWDVGIASNGNAFLTTKYSGGSSDPLMRLDLSDDSISNEPGQTTYTDRNIWTSPNDGLLVMASDVFSPRIYDAATDTFTTQGAAMSDSAVAISPDNQLIAAATYSTLIVYDATLQNTVFTEGNYDLNGGVVFDPVRDLMYVGDSDTNRVVAYDTNTWTVQYEFTGFLHGLQRYQDYSEGLISISPDGRLLSVSTGDAIQSVRLTPRHRVELGNGDVVGGLNFGEQSQTDYLSVEFASGAIAENAGAAATVGTARRNTTDLTNSVVVFLSSSAPSEISIPTSVTILAGQATATFDIDAVDDNLLDGPQIATITAAAAGLAAGQGALTVDDHETLTISLPVTTVTEADGPDALTGTVTRNNSDLSAALTVFLASDDESEAKVPASVVIPSGQTSADFSVEAVDELLADGDQVAQLTASSSGYAGDAIALTVQDDDLNVPVMIGPAGMTSDTTPTFTWNAVTDATSYELWVYHANTQTHKIVYETGITGTSFTPTTALPAGSFQFWLRAHAAGRKSPWSSTGHFAIGVTLSAPTLTAPGGNTSDTTPTFSWNAVSNASTYELWVYSITANTHQIIHQTGLTAASYTPTAGEALPAGEYRFWVRAADSAGNNGPWSASLAFSVGSIPDVPALIGPSGISSDTTPTFSWQDVGADRYVLWVTESASGQRVIFETNLTTNSFTPSASLASGAHTFWVQAFNSAGQTNGWSARSDFTIGAVLPAPTILGPAGNTFDTTPTFTWNAVATAVRYELSVYNQTTSTHNVIHETNLTGTSFTPAAMASGRYQYWMRTQSAAGLWGAWSVATNFSVGIPEIPAIIGPTGTTTDTTPTFSWNATAGAARYELWVYNFTTGVHQVIHDTNITSTSYTSGIALTVGHTYWFWVRAFNDDDLAGEWSDRSEFVIIA